MVDFNKAKATHKKPEKAASNIPLPAGCKEQMLIGNEPIANLAIGESVTGTILEIKSVQTETMEKPNNLITFSDETYGRVKFWSSGALNNLLDEDLIGPRLTIQRIEDEHFAKGDGKNWRIFKRD